SLQCVDREPPPLWILAGGGWKKPVIRRELENRFRKKGAHIPALMAGEKGWGSQALEAQIFSHFSLRSLQKKPLSLPGTTGVPYPLSGGRTWHGKRTETH